MSWELEITGKRPTTLNQERKRNNWGHRATDTKWWREKFCDLAVDMDVPALDRIRISVFPLHKDGRSPQDTGACFPAAKAAIDGLVDAGIVEDDTADQVVRVDFHAPITHYGLDGLRIVVQEA
jgi:hypothetical protein